MRRELLDIDLGRRRQPLRPQCIMAKRRAIDVGERWKAELGTGLVGGYQRRRVLDRRRRSRQMRNARLLAAVHGVAYSVSTISHELVRFDAGGVDDAFVVGGDLIEEFAERRTATANLEQALLCELGLH